MDHNQPLPPFTIAAPKLFDGTSMRGHSLVTISGGLIESVSFGQAPSPATISLPADAILAPGLIDIQVNGGGGVLLNDKPTEQGGDDRLFTDADHGSH
jgi:N-acetylglucosamine-6-phosphate deacetylase